MARRRIMYKKNNGYGAGFILCILAFMLVIIGIHSLRLWNTQRDLKEQHAQLQQQIDDEQLRTVELSEFRKYVQTDSYAQEVAQDKLGLVHEGEIVFRIDKK